MNKLIITAAITGAEVTKEDNPNLPVSPEELADAAVEAENAGASIIHLHVRDRHGKPTQSLKVFKRTVTLMKERGLKAIIQPSTGGAQYMSCEERMQPLELDPEMASLDCGTINFGEGIFDNNLPLIRKFAREMKRRNVFPELECFEAGHLSTAMLLESEGLLPPHLHFDIVLGIPGAMTASIKNLLFMVESLPPKATWTAAAVGRHQLPIALISMLMGGHVRVGFEDNIYYQKGVLARSNAQLVERVVRIAKEVGREIATPDESRKILQIKGIE